MHFCSVSFCLFRRPTLFQDTKSLPFFGISPRWSCLRFSLDDNQTSIHLLVFVKESRKRRISYEMDDELQSRTVFYFCFFVFFSVHFLFLLLSHVSRFLMNFWCTDRLTLSVRVHFCLLRQRLSLDPFFWGKPNLWIYSRPSSFLAPVTFYSVGLSSKSQQFSRVFSSGISIYLTALCFPFGFQSVFAQRHPSPPSSPVLLHLSYTRRRLV